MTNSILQDLYNSKIYLFENICVNNTEYQKINSTLAEEKECFLTNLSEGDREFFKKIEDLHYESCGIYSYESFAHGFRLGVKLIFEALNDTDNLSRNDDK